MLLDVPMKSETSPPQREALGGKDSEVKKFSRCYRDWDKPDPYSISK